MANISDVKGVSTALVLGKSTFDKLSKATGFDAETAASLVETLTYRGRTFYVSTDTSHIVMALNVTDDGVCLELGKETKDTRYYAMSCGEFIGLLKLLKPRVSKDHARELFTMALQIEENERTYSLSENE